MTKFKALTRWRPAPETLRSSLSPNWPTLIAGRTYDFAALRPTGTTMWLRCTFQVWPAHMPNSANSMTLGRGSCTLQLSVCCTFQPPFPLTQRGRPWRGSRCPSHRDQCGARSARARQAGSGIWPGAPERTRGPRPHCVRRPPEPRRRRRRTLPQRSRAYAPAIGEREDGDGAALRGRPECQRARAARMYPFPPTHLGRR